MFIPTKGQELPYACTESWVRYDATPDPMMGGYPSRFEWILDQNGIKDFRIYDNGDSINILWSNKPGRYNIGLVEISEMPELYTSECRGDTIWSYVDVRGVVINIGPNQELCYNDSFVFDAGEGFVSYLWNNNSTDRFYSGRGTKNDTISVSVISNYLCRGSDTAIITVHPNPFVDIKDLATGASFNDTMLCGIGSITLDAGSDGTFYNWNNGQITNTINIAALDPLSKDSAIVYSVTVENEFGCTLSDSITLFRCVAPSSNDIPNVFTPNGDGKGDIWRIPNLMFYPKATVDVYDRWGRLIFHTTGKENKYWDGTSEGKDMPMSTYFYIIKGISEKEIIGTVSLLR